MVSLLFCVFRCIERRIADAACWTKRPFNRNGNNTGIFLQLLKNEGPRSVYLGLTPSLTRSVLYGGLRLGLYEPTKVSFDWAFGSTTVLVKIASGAFAGGFSTALTNPVEVFKVGLQMNPNAVPMAQVREIVSKGGIGALWKGFGPAMVRAAALTASQLET
ncbi:unnamed protein product [Brassica rapa subsp. trilocularis]